MNENKLISLPIVFASSFLVVFIGVVATMVVGARLIRPQPQLQPTIRPTAHLVLFQPTATLTIPPTLTFTPIPTTTPSPTPTDTATPAPPTPTATETLAPGVTPSPTVPPSPTLPPSPTPPTLRLTPGQPQPYLEQYRLVTYYGVPTGPQLGILGSAPRPTMLQDLRSIAAQYQALSPDRFVMPTYHMITTIADPFPGEVTVQIGKRRNVNPSKSG